MRIDAIAVCVGEHYANLFARALPIWRDTLDSLTVITTPRDVATLELCVGDVRLLTSNIFTAAGAHFNKAGALNLAFEAASPGDWCLALDADIVPPAEWREIAEREADPACLCGARRVDEVGQTIRQQRQFVPYGYFQLWRAEPGQAPFTEYVHAGSYDADFAERWPPERWLELSFRVTHHGPTRRNWFGEGRESEMEALVARGLRTARKMGFGRL